MIWPLARQAPRMAQEDVQMPQDDERSHPSRSYPGFYEKAIPIALGTLVVIIVIVLLVTVAIALRLIPGAA